MDQLLVIPGMDDKTNHLEWATRHWPQKFGLAVTVHPFGWEQPIETYDASQAETMKLVEYLASLGPLATWGASAGGHKAIHLLALRPDLVSCAINSCGFSSRAGWQGQPRHAKFRHSLKLFEQTKFPAERVMTFRPKFDELVKPKLVPIEGATNIEMRTVTHFLSIGWSFTGRRKEAIEFIKENRHRSTR